MADHDDDSLKQGSPRPGASRAVPPVNSAVQQAFSRALLQFAILLGASFVTTFLQLPFRLVSVAFALVAAVWGAVAVVRFWKKDIAHNQLAVFVMGVVAALFMAAMTGSSLARWDIDMTYQNCVSQAVTQQAKARCFTAYESDLKSLLPGSK